MAAVVTRWMSGPAAVLMVGAMLAAPLPANGTGGRFTAQPPIAAVVTAAASSAPRPARTAGSTPGSSAHRSAATAGSTPGSLGRQETRAAAAINPAPPPNTVKLVFVHHSVGENWLSDGYGGLARALQANRYYLSDSNYGWGPNRIGDRTDIPDWLEWFASARTPTYMSALRALNRVSSPYRRTRANPGGPNQIVLFKSCFPNSSLAGHPSDPPTKGSGLTVGNAKYVYNRILQHFATQPRTLFVVITAPPNSDAAHAANARAFNNWLVTRWLASYRLRNVAVFDFYNVLTGPANHHRVFRGAIQHVYTPGRNTTYYPSGDDHPNVRGSRKATTEFVPMLNAFYHRWVGH